MGFKVGELVLVEPEINGEKCPKEFEKFIAEPLEIKNITELGYLHFDESISEVKYGLPMHCVRLYCKTESPPICQNMPAVEEYIADHPQKKQQEFQSGMKRNDSTGKPRFDLICPLSQDYDKTLLYRWAMLLTKGMEIYSARNWEQANGLAELESFKASAERHFRQAMAGDTTEDHFAAVLFNLNGIVYLMDKLNCDVKGVHK